jgi:hypothetical protein
MVARTGGEAVKFTNSRSFSMNTKVKTVCGLSGQQQHIGGKGRDLTLASTTQASIPSSKSPVPRFEDHRGPLAPPGRQPSQIRTSTGAQEYGLTYTRPLCCALDSALQHVGRSASRRRHCSRHERRQGMCSDVVLQRGTRENDSFRCGVWCYL